jgi:hypothetical protein
MTSSLIDADRSTHWKIIAIALAAACLVVIIGLSAATDSGSGIASGPSTPTVVKAGSSMSVTSRTGVAVR